MFYILKIYPDILEFINNIRYSEALFR